MATTEARPHGRVITGRIGDPQEGVRQPEPIVLPDAAWLFSRTADRLVALADGFRESAESWADLLRDAKRRGMTIVPIRRIPPCRTG